MQESIILYNPVSTSQGKQRLPMSLLTIAAPLAEQYDIHIIDGNLENDPITAIQMLIDEYHIKLIGMTVMPGPQLRQAVPIAKAIKQTNPNISIVWGGYFPSNHYDVVVQSDWVDFVIIGQGEQAFTQFVEAFFTNQDYEQVPSLAYINDGQTQVTKRAKFVNLNDYPYYPYHLLDMEQYIGTSYLGNRVGAHHTSWGCPFACSFCAVVPLAKQRWLAESAERVIDITRWFKHEYHIDGMEYHDMDFFVNEGRTEAIAEGLIGLDIRWWGLGRVDTLLSYSDTTFEKMAKSGVSMIFMGAESGDDDTLKLMNKGGKSGTAQTLAIIERMKQYDIVPELSFVLGNPPDPIADIEKTIKFIRKVKQVNPATELVLYLYTPTPQEGSIMLDEAVKLGFSFPQTLEEWASDEWADKSLRRNPGTPWSKDPIRKKIRDFETVVNAYYPTVTDIRLQGTMRQVLKTLSGWRYRVEFYRSPYELKLLQRLLQYRRPETMGF